MRMDELLIANIFYIIETMGILSFALSGMILAKRKNFDPIGIYVIACVTAFGGGTLRDLILDAHPVYWISHSEYPAIILVFVLLAYFFKHIPIKPSWLFLPDSLGLSLFAITGARIAVEAGGSLITVGILATMTATFGGIIRDTLCQEIPVIFKKETTLYASLAFFGGCLYYGLINYTQLLQIECMVASSCAIFLCRLISAKMGWRFKA